MSDKRVCVFVSLRVSACECVCVQYLESAKRAVKLSASVLYTSSVKDVNSSSRSSKCKRCSYLFFQNKNKLYMFSKLQMIFYWLLFVERALKSFIKTDIRKYSSRIYDTKTYFYPDRDLI